MDVREQVVEEAGTLLAGVFDGMRINGVSVSHSISRAVQRRLRQIQAGKLTASNGLAPVPEDPAPLPPVPAPIAPPPIPTPPPVPPIETKDDPATLPPVPPAAEDKAAKPKRARKAKVEEEPAAPKPIGMDSEVTWTSSNATKTGIVVGFVPKGRTAREEGFKVGEGTTRDHDSFVVKGTGDTKGLYWPRLSLLKHA